jgi:hypothetical protein
MTPGMLVSVLLGTRSQAAEDHSLRILYRTNIRSQKIRRSLLVAKYLFLDAFAKFRKATTCISFVMCFRTSVRPHGTSRLPLDEFS